MPAKKLGILQQDQDFESVLAEEYRRAAGVSETFASDLMKLNRGPNPSVKKGTSAATRELAKKLIGKS